MKDYYYILGIPRSAEEDEIKAAFRKLSVKFHPDKNNGDRFFEERFKDLTEAYEVLTDKNRKVVYDKLIKEAAPEDSGSFDAYERASGFKHAFRNKSDRKKIAVLLTVGSVGLTLMMLSFFGGLNDKKSHFEGDPALQLSSVSAMSSFSEEDMAATMPEFASLATTEEWLLQRLSTHTPQEIFEKNSINVTWDTTAGHIEKMYEYKIAEGQLIIEHVAFYKDDEPLLNRTLIPLQDIERVYHRDGYLRITTRSQSIIEDHLINRTRFNTAVFTVQYDISREPDLEKKLSFAFKALKKHYAYHGGNR